jgi:hypothetical protein
MKKIIALSAVAAGAALLASCATPFPMGTLYTGVSTGEVANNNVAITKTGEACNTSIFSLIATGDASVRAAKASAGITNVATIDHTANNYFGIYGSYCTIVRGN